MKTIKVSCLILVALNFITMLIFSEHKTPGRQLFAMATNGFLMILFVATLFDGLLKCTKEKFRAFIPAAICITGIFASFFVGSYLGNMLENRRINKDLPSYVSIAHRIEKGEIKTGTSLSRIELPAQDKDLAQITLARTNNEGAVIEFVTGLGFPVKHSGYLYISTGKIDNETDSLRRWPYHARINVNWFRVED